jgi:hypothetical protein
VGGSVGPLVEGNCMGLDISSRVHIGEVIRNAVLFNPGNPQDRLMNSDNLIETVGRFFTLLSERQIDYVLVGGIALLQYVEGRNTEDIDLIMAVSALERLPELEVNSHDVDFARGKFGELKVDLLLTSNPLFEEVQKRFTTSKHFVEHAIPCATVEGLVLLKLYALPSLYRQGNFTRVGLTENDIATLIHIHKPDLRPILDVLEDYLSSSDMAQVRQIVNEIKERLERFKQRT